MLNRQAGYGKWEFFCVLQLFTSPKFAICVLGGFLVLRESRLRELLLFYRQSWVSHGVLGVDYLFMFYLFSRQW